MKAMRQKPLIIQAWTKGQHQKQRKEASGKVGIGSRSLILKNLLDFGLEFEINYKGNKKLLKDLKVIRFVLKTTTTPPTTKKENDSGFCEENVCW